MVRQVPKRRFKKWEVIGFWGKEILIRHVHGVSLYILQPDSNQIPRPQLKKPKTSWPYSISILLQQKEKMTNKLIILNLNMNKMCFGSKI